MTPFSVEEGASIFYVKMKATCVEERCYHMILKNTFLFYLNNSSATIKSCNEACVRCTGCT